MPLTLSYDHLLAAVTDRIVTELERQHGVEPTADVVQATRFNVDLIAEVVSLRDHVVEHHDFDDYEDEDAIFTIANALNTALRRLREQGAVETLPQPELAGDVVVPNDLSGL